jgi:hypothetical protein
MSSSYFNINPHQKGTIQDEKEFFWKTFIQEWEVPYILIKGAIKLINLYPQRLMKVGLGNLLDFDQIDESQKEWVWLYSRLENRIETDYFKPYFVPINSDDYKVFIDISQPQMPFYEPGYNWIDHCWDHLTRFDSIMELLEYLESDDTKSPPIDKEFSKHLESLIRDIELPEI